MLFKGADKLLLMICYSYLLKLNITKKIIIFTPLNRPKSLLIRILIQMKSKNLSIDFFKDEFKRNK